MEFLSPEKQKELEKELEYLVTVKRKKISRALAEASALGDLSENVEYQEAKEEQSQNERRIAELEDLLSKAVVLSQQSKSRKYVEIGCFVALKGSSGGIQEKYQIVGVEDADPVAKKISHQSPLGAALLGKKKGSKVVVLTPNGEMRYTIVDII